MTSLITQPQLMTTAAADAAQISSAITQAKAAAAGPTTGLVAAAQDEVSTITASLFGSYGQQYQAMLQQATTFHDQFAAALAAGGNAYATAEAEAAAEFGALTAPIRSLFAPLSGSAPNTGYAVTQVDPTNALIMTGSGTPTPPQNYINAVYSHYLNPNFPVPVTGVQGLSTPEGLYPFTGVKDLTLNISVGRGVTILNNAILQQIAAGHTVAVLGYSQSAVLASVEMPQLVAEGVPSSAVDFVLLGNPMNPNGGLLSRFPGLSLQSLGITFYGATPSNDYPTVTYTQEYDGFADFPQYPINPLSDLNALLGIVYVHGQYPYLNPAALPPGYSITTLPTQGPTMSTYYMINIPNLPLLDPVRSIPVIGNPVADLLQPDLTYLVNWGYGNPAFGYSTGPANVPTPFGFLPPLGATTALGPDLMSGTQQGMSAFANDLALEAPSLSATAMSLPSMASALVANPSSTLALAAASLPTAQSVQSTLTSALAGIASANNNVVGALTNGVSTAYATLLPTADIGTAVAVTLPSYDVDLFLNGITQAINGDPTGLLNAIGDPIAADVGLTTLAGGFELISLENAFQTILTGTPNPGLGNTYPGLG
jgi:PE-PPE domain/PE family